MHIFLSSLTHQGASEMYLFYLCICLSVKCYNPSRNIEKQQGSRNNKRIKKMRESCFGLDKYRNLKEFLVNTFIAKKQVILHAYVHPKPVGL